MKNLLILFLVATALLNKTNAQVITMGFGMDQYKQTGMILESYDPGTGGLINIQNDVDEVHRVLGGHVGYYKHFLKKDKFTVGAIGEFGFFAYYKKVDAIDQFGNPAGSKSSGMYLGYSTPLYIMAKYGAYSSLDEEEGVGVEFGPGWMFNGFTIPDDKGFISSFSLRFGLRYKGYGIKVDLPFKPFTSSYTDSFGTKIPRLENKYLIVHLDFNVFYEK